MKIKSFLLIMTLIIGIVSSYFLYTDYNYDLYYKYQSFPDAISILEDKKANIFFLQFKGNDKVKYDEFIEGFSQYYNDTFIFVYATQDVLTEYTHYSMFTTNNKILDDLEKRNCKSIDFSDTKGRYYYSSCIKDTNSKGTIEILDNDLFDLYNRHIVIETINSLPYCISDMNDIALYLFNDDSQEAERILNEFLSICDLNTHISWVNLSDGYSPAQLELITSNNMNDYKNIILYMAVIYVIFLMILFTKKKKELMIKKIHGFSTFATLNNDLILFVLLNFILFNMTFYVTSYILSLGRIIFESELLLRMVSISLFLLMIFIIVVVVMLMIVRCFSDAIVLKRNDLGYRNIISAMLLKILVLLMISQPLLSIMSSSYSMGINYYYMKKNATTVNDLYYIDTNLFKGSDKLVDYYLTNDGYYCDFNTYRFNTIDFLKEHFPDVDEEDLKKQAFDYPVIFVNANYISAQGYEIKDTDGRIIDIHHIEEDRIFVPSKYINKNIDIVKSNGTQKYGDIKITEIMNTGIFTNYKSDEPYTLNNPVIYLLTENYWNINMQNLYLKGELDQISSTIKLFTDEDIPLVSMEQRFTSNLVQNENKFKENLIVLLLYLVVFVGAIYQIVFWFVEEYKKLLMIEYISGKSKLERYSDLFIMSSIVYLIPLMINTMIMGSALKDILTFYMATIVFELVLILLFVYHMEKNSISVILKGENGI